MARMRSIMRGFRSSVPEANATFTGIRKTERSDLGFGCGEFAGGYLVLEAGAGVGAVAERLVLGCAAAAEADGCASGEAEGAAGGVEDFEIAFNADGTVVIYCDF